MAQLVVKEPAALTSIVIDEADGSLGLAQDARDRHVVIRRKSRKAVLEIINGHSQILRSVQHELDKQQRERLFQLFENIDWAEAEKIVRQIFSCDGPSFEITLRYSDLHVRKISGGVLPIELTNSDLIKKLLWPDED